MVVRPARSTLFPYTTLFRSREGLPPAARALADAGERLALGSLEIDPGYERAVGAALGWRAARSEEHTSELQSRLHLVCRLVPAKKNRPAHERCRVASVAHAR